MPALNQISKASDSSQPARSDADSAAPGMMTATTTEGQPGSTASREGAAPLNTEHTPETSDPSPEPFRDPNVIEQPWSRPVPPPLIGAWDQFVRIVNRLAWESGFTSTAARDSWDQLWAWFSKIEDEAFGLMAADQRGDESARAAMVGLLKREVRRCEVVMGNFRGVDWAG